MDTPQKQNKGTPAKRIEFSTPKRVTPIKDNPKESVMSVQRKTRILSPTHTETERQSFGPTPILVSPKKFSPLSAKGLMTLMESPLLVDGKKQAREDKKTPKSKKMLYH